jgi:pseudaminic acid biosynthesis-associated methylase
MHKKQTIQEKFWLSKFGKEYWKRNNFTPDQLDKFYMKNLGVSRSKINKDFIGNLNLQNTLEVGCNIGIQLNMLQKYNHKLGQIYGLELLPEAVEVAKANTKNCNIIQGSAFDIPFKDNYFDLVYTSGVLIHISPKDITRAMKEIYRVSRKYIWGVEFYNPKHVHINYRGNKNYHWKGDFAKIYLDNIPGLKLIKEQRYEKIKGEIWTSFLLRKK